MAVLMYLKVDDIKGEASDPDFKDQIEILSWNWNVVQTGRASTGSSNIAAAVNITDLSLVKYVDASTPTLFKSCCAATLFKTAVLSVVAAGNPKNLRYFELKLSDGIVSSLSAHGVSEGERMQETLALNFKTAQITYYKIADGKLGGAIPGGYDLAQHRLLGS